MLRGISNEAGAPRCASSDAVDANEAAVAEATPAAVVFRNERRSECMRSPADG
jgi:hypothetical protein